MTLMINCPNCGLVPVERVEKRTQNRYDHSFWLGETIHFHCRRCGMKWYTTRNYDGDVIVHPVGIRKVSSE